MTKEEITLLGNKGVSLTCIEFNLYFQQEVLPLLDGKTVKGWVINSDPVSGTIYIYKKSIDTSIYMTPCWDGQDGLPVDLESFHVGRMPIDRNKMPRDPKKIASWYLQKVSTIEEYLVSRIKKEYQAGLEREIAKIVLHVQ
jgi:hypothetical protein